jgi:hypothetical protein
MSAVATKQTKVTGSTYRKCQACSYQMQRKSVSELKSEPKSDANSNLLISCLGEVNTDPFTIQRIAGHSSITMSQRYVHPTPERLEDAFARLESYNQMKVAAKPNTASPAVN